MTSTTAQRAFSGVARAHVIEELQWSPELDPTDIHVGVEGSVVTLTGRVDSFPEKLAAERAAYRVRGVSAVRDLVDVQPDDDRFTDPAIADAVRHALEWRSNVPSGVHVAVEGGHVVLTGELTWDFQRQAARHAAGMVAGVRSVDNRITLARKPSASDTGERIRNALVRDAILGAHAITVEADDTRIILRGTVHSWAEKAQAARTAWSSPHVTQVDNRIIVETP